MSNSAFAPLLTTLRHDRDSAGPRRVTLAVLAVLSVLAAAVGVLGAESGVTAAARTWHVAVGGNDAASGAADAPLATIAQAVRVAESGDTIRIGAGRYHESVQVYREALTIVGAGAGQTVLDGAVPVAGFRADSDGRYSAPWSTRFDRATRPFTSEERPEGGWPEQFFLDGVQLTQVASRSEVVAGTFFHDLTHSRVVLADDPSGRLVEGSDLNWGFYLNLADGSSLEGLTVQRYATQERNMAAIRAYGNDIAVRDVEVRDNARIGVSAIGARITVERVTAIDNGHLGIHGHRSHRLAVVDNTVHRNNREFFDAWHSAGGIKVTEVTGFEVRGNDVRDNDGPGIWTDLDVRDAVIAENVVVGNLRSGVEIELSTGVIVVDNVVARNGEQGVWVLESSEVDVWHNHLTDHERAVWVLDGPRADLVGVRIGNNVLAGPASAGVLLAVDDWTEQRKAADMRVRLDGNRYWSADGDDLVRWANWPQSLTITADLGTVRSVTGQELNGQSSSAAELPYGSATDVLVSVPTRVASVRSGATATTSGGTAQTGSQTGATTTPTNTSGGTASPSVGGIRDAGPAVVVRNPADATATRSGSSASTLPRTQSQSFVEPPAEALGENSPETSNAGSGLGGWDAFASALERVLGNGQR